LILANPHYNLLNYALKSIKLAEVMNVVAIIQARMSSTRLPGKVLMPLVGKPVLEHVVSRIEYCKTIQKIVVATSVDSSDDAIEIWCNTRSISCFRGSLNDVLDRYYQAAKQYKADAIVRITADCPVIDPTIVDEVVSGYSDGGFEFFGLSGEFPDGLDCTVFAFSAIERAWKESTLYSEREHVGPYIEKHPELFKSGTLVKFKDLAHYRWTLDEMRDYEFLQAIFSRLYRDDGPFLTQDILTLLIKERALTLINSNIIRNEGYLKSLKTDQENHIQPRRTQK
jgi:spore coat polysaccharide biosynthesis protein SpsF